MHASFSNEIEFFFTYFKNLLWNLKIFFLYDIPHVEYKTHIGSLLTFSFAGNPSLNWVPTKPTKKAKKQDPEFDIV